jgi:hypothetical protein
MSKKFQEMSLWDKFGGGDADGTADERNHQSGGTSKDLANPTDPDDISETPKPSGWTDAIGSRIFDGTAFLLRKGAEGTAYAATKTAEK